MPRPPAAPPLAGPAAYAPCIAVIESQHAAMFRLVVAFMQARSLPALRRHVRRLLALSSQHFAYQEALMQRLAFVDCDEHTRAHAQLLQRLAQLRQHVSGSALDKMEMGVFLKHWEHTHATLADARLTEFLRCCGTPGSFL